MVDSTRKSDFPLIRYSSTWLIDIMLSLTTLVAWSMALLAERPDIQQKALDEIRKVHQEDAPLCDADDDQSIPYIVALVRELLRYYTVLRLSLPRATVKDVIYQGKTIPSGSVVFLNAWACNMDDEVWKDPEVFRPERWLEQPDAPLFTYGLGYRMCAGSLLANREMYTIYLRMLGAFTIEDVEAEHGGKVDTHPVTGVEDQTQLVSVPQRYKVRLVPRNKEALRKALEEAEKKS